MPLPHTLMRSSRLSEWLFSSEKISESSWNVRKLSLLREKHGRKSAMVPPWGLLLGLSSAHPKDPRNAHSSSRALLFGGYSRVFHMERRRR